MTQRKPTKPNRASPPKKGKRKTENAHKKPISNSQNANQVVRELKAEADPVKAAFFPRFFKAGPGEYGEGDKFIGVIVPTQRKIAKRYKQLELNEVERLLDNDFHECRLTALLILTHQFQAAVKNEDVKRQANIYRFYRRKVDRINNWDLVDSSAHKIVGPYLQDRDRKPLVQWAKAKHLWKNRIAMLATFHFIRSKDFATTLELAEILVDHQHDLIHKAVGWMLREIGNRNENCMLSFIQAHPDMPRTMLRYAIEKLPPEQRKRILKK